MNNIFTDVINNYSNALNLLDDYDHKTVSKPKGTSSKEQINYEECMDIVNKLRFNSESDLFALERKKGLDSIIKNIYQSFGGVDVYPSIEEKAANFLYLIIKNHAFIDGNKRTAVIFANHLLISKGLGLIAIPEDKVKEYKQLLIAYYEGADTESIKAFLKKECYQKI